MHLALINMPSALAVCPSTALGALSAILRISRHTCDEVYANVEYAAFIGFEQYHQIFNEYDLLAGNFLFAEHANIVEIKKNQYYDALYERQGLERDFLPSLISLMDSVIDKSGPFLDYLLDSRDWSRYDVFGFSSTFQQQAATIAFARRLKVAFPNKPIICGGANFHSDMGKHWLRSVRSFDYICTGEGEDTLPMLMNYLDGKSDVDEIPNLVYRDNEIVVATPNKRFKLDNLLTPEYDGFYAIASQTRINEHMLWEYHRLPIETSRGCWWGAKQHCIFCGLNGSDMSYESAADMVALKHIERTVSRYNVRHIQFVDNIMPRSYANYVFPALAMRGYDLTAFYEIKANLTIDELRALRSGGIIQLQPGIESLNKNLLKKIKKGITGLQNVFFLKWARYFGIEISWNLLWGIPGECWADYQRQMKIFAAIVHLDPPGSMPEIRIQRFSPMQARPEEFGIVGLRTARTFAAIFPDFAEEHDKLTYFFDIDGRVGLSLDEAREVFAVVDNWRKRFSSGATLSYARLPGCKVSVEDRREPNVRRTDVFAYPASLIYELCSINICGVPKLVEILRTRYNLDVSAEDTKYLLDQFCDRCLMLEEDGMYFAIAVPVTNLLRTSSVAEYLARLEEIYKVGQPVLA